MRRLFRYTRGEERHMLDSSFEPHGDGYVFYRHHFARGVPVTAAEREAYLRPPLGGSRRDFHEAIRGRPASLPRRSWWGSQRATLAAIPAQIGLALILVGAMLLWRSRGFDEPPLRWLLTTAGVLGTTYGTLVLAVRLFARGGRERAGAPAEAPPLTPDEKLIQCRRFE
jgi:hypothetical protein